MNSYFPTDIQNLPEADIPIEGLKSYLSQSDNHQIIFMEFDKYVEVPLHSHESQWAIVVEGKIELTIGEETKTYRKGDRYFIPKDVLHGAKIFPGYSDVTFFNQKDRYKKK